MDRTLFKVVLATTGFALIHSLLASRAAKEAAAGLFGKRHRNGLYRPFYLLQSVLSLAMLAAYLSRLPDKTLYQVRGLPALFFRLGQASGLVYALITAYYVGISRILGWTSFTAWLRRSETVPPEPEAQGPSLDENGHLQTTGPFKWSRHPLNFAPIPVFWLNPHMTVKLAVFNLATTLYLVLGSIHEEIRLRAAYGNRYVHYQHAGIPFYLPLLV